MDVVLLGTGSPMPDANRAGPATLLKTGEGGLEQVLVDAGRGCVMRMAAAGSLPAFLQGVLITHLHSDHLTDLNDIMTTQWVMAPQGTTLKVWGPPGIQRYVDHMLKALEPARPDGLGAGVANPPDSALGAAALIATGIAFLLLPPLAALLAIAVMALSAAAAIWLARTNIGGYTGDVLGAGEQIAETAVLIALAAYFLGA